MFYLYHMVYATFNFKLVMIVWKKNYMYHSRCMEICLPDVLSHVMLESWNVIWSRLALEVVNFSPGHAYNLNIILFIICGLRLGKFGGFNEFPGGPLSTYALFVLVIMFSRKWVIFQIAFSIKLSHFPKFGSNLKWVKKQSPNFSYLACYEIELFSKKI